MAFDTEAKRRSAMHQLLPFFPASGEPTGTITQGDRQEVIWIYRGILAPAAAAAVAAFTLTFTVSQESLTIDADQETVTLSDNTESITITHN